MEQRNRIYKLRLNESDFKLIAKLIDTLDTPIEVMYYMLERSNIEAFVIILLAAQNVDIDEVLIQHKRETDILFCIDETLGLHAILCQETKIDGAYMFAERMIAQLSQNGGESIYCTELEVKTTRYSTKELIFRVYETYQMVKVENREEEVVIKTIQ